MSNKGWRINYHFSKKIKKIRKTINDPMYFHAYIICENLNTNERRRILRKGLGDLIWMKEEEKCVSVW